MNKKFRTKAGIATIGAVLSAYVIFLALPVALNPIVNNYSSEITKAVKTASGLESEIKDIKFITTPKLTAGLKVGNFKLLTPNGEQVFDANDFQVKMSLLTLLKKQIRIDVIQLKDADVFILL